MSADHAEIFQTFRQERDYYRRDLGQRAQSALADYLKSYHWDCMFTATYSRPANRPRLAIDRVLKTLPTGIVRGFVAGEPHYLGNFHAHGLLAQDSPPENYTYLFTPVDAFREHLKRLGWSVVETVESVDCASAYCAKYVSKGLADYEFWGDWNKRTEEIK